MKRWLWAGVPAATGLLLALAAGLATPNPVFYMRASLAALLFLASLLVSLALAGVIFWQREAHKQDQKAEALLAQVAAERRRFLHRLDHELKNPLTAIRTGLANAAETAEDGDRRQALETVQAQATRLSRLTADLRKLADLESRPLERAPVSMGGLLAEAMALVHEQPAAADRRLILAIPEAPWPLPAVQGDRDLLFLAVYNLLDNALKFSGAGDTIELRAREEGDAVLVEVADTGPGIAPGELAHVWDELYRGGNASAVVGSGLGLSLVRAIVERHQGSVALRSRPEQGTLASLRLPASP